MRTMKPSEGWKSRLYVSALALLPVLTVTVAVRLRTLPKEAPLQVARDERIDEEIDQISLPLNAIRVQVLENKVAQEQREMDRLKHRIDQVRHAKSLSHEERYRCTYSLMDDYDCLAIRLQLHERQIQQFKQSALRTDIIPDQ